MSNSTAGPGPAGPDAELLLQRVSAMIGGARALPLSSSVKLDNKDEILELLREAIERLPQELRQARWMLKERDEYLEATERNPTSSSKRHGPRRSAWSSGPRS